MTIEYWYARSGDNVLARNNYTPVHWKGFVALFAVIFGCIGLLLLSVLLVVVGVLENDNMTMVIAAEAAGTVGVVSAFYLAFKAWKYLRKRVDPVNNAAHYRKKFFGKLSGK